MTWLTQAYRRFFPANPPRLEYGTMPGMVWSLKLGRWVDEAETYKRKGDPSSGAADYVLVGPVYQIVSGRL